MSSPLSDGTYNEHLKPLAWLIGRWITTEASAFYPTIKTFSYVEELEFTPNGQQPVLLYKAQAYDPVTKSMMHTETGYLRIIPETKTVVFMLAHNYGLSELSEGEVGDNELHLQSQHLFTTPRSTIVPATKLHRHFSLKDQALHGKLEMATNTQPLQDHLYTTYKKRED